jgi:TonB family protein
MSGETVLAQFKKPKPTRLEKEMELENDRRLFGSMGSSSILGFALIAFALTITPIIPPPFYDSPNDPRDPLGPITGRLPENIHVKLHPKIVKTPPLKTAHQAPAPKVKNPVKVAGTMVQKLIVANSNRSDYGAYELINKTLKNLDQNKLEQVAVLTRTGETRLAGRLGKQSNAFNEGYYVDGTGDGKDNDFTLPSPDIERIPSRVPKGPGLGKITEIEVQNGEMARSSASILAVVRSHSPGLRHIYNTYLRKFPGMQGKVTLRFAIAPSGQVVDVGVAASSTEVPDFDNQILAQVMAWRFERVKSIGNDIVTVPFNFSE